MGQDTENTEENTEEKQTKTTKIKITRSSKDKSEKLNKLYSIGDGAKCEFKNCDCNDVKLDEKQLKIQEELKSRRYMLKKEIADNCEITQSLSNIGNPAKADRIYKLSATDLFVEKAIHLLDQQVTEHEENGKKSFKYAYWIIIVGVIIAFFNMINLFPFKNAVYQDVNATYIIKQATQYDSIIKSDDKSKEEHSSSKINENIVKTIIDKDVSLAWKDALVAFMKSFTFYGLLVLSAVFLKRQGKASLDQAERIKDRRHALREGRLYIHLKDGQIKTVEELEQAFNWNNAQNNAFADVNTEAQAPWGTVFKEFANMFPKAIEASKK